MREYQALIFQHRHAAIAFNIPLDKIAGVFAEAVRDHARGRK